VCWFVCGCVLWAGVLKVLFVSVCVCVWVKLLVDWWMVVGCVLVGCWLWMGCGRLLCGDGFLVVQGDMGDIG
jgi:hypothetical protein